MCGRFTLFATVADLEERFDLEMAGVQFGPRYNIAPNQATLALPSKSNRQPEMLTWGMRPAWWKEAGRTLINVRSESLGNPTFRSQFRSHRCLVFADGFYEWAVHDGRREPWRFVMESGEPFAMAGLWETEGDAAGPSRTTFSILTAPANRLISTVHDRMPCILRPEHEDLWLDSRSDAAALLGALLPYDAHRMDAYRVALAVNNARLESPLLISPIV